MMETVAITPENNDFYGIFPKYISVSSKAPILPTSKELDPSKAEKTLLALIEKDNRVELVDASKNLFKSASNQVEDFETTQTIDHRFALRLLHLSCYLDSVECAEALIDGKIGPGLDVNDFDLSGRTALHCAAEMHAKRCVELLLRRKARADLRSADEDSQLPLEMALSSQKMIVWSTEQTIEDLLVSLSEMDLSVVKMLTEKTREITEVAYASAIEGQIVSLAALLMQVPEKVMSSIMVLRPDGGLASKEMTTIYQCVIREAIYVGVKESSMKRSRQKGLPNSKELRKLLLCEIELLQLFGAAVFERTHTMVRRVVSPLIRASQAGDEEVVKLLLKTDIDVNETDGEGNSALLWYLKSSSKNLKPRILLLLIKHGANVSQRNKLGLTPLHTAAASGYYQALEVLLLKDPGCVDAVSEMKETPLFFAVKNDFMNCAQLLLRNGANNQILNLRKQRPMDLAKSQDMRFLLNQDITFWNRPIQSEEGTSWLKDYQLDSDEETFEPSFDSKRETGFPKKLSSNAKTEICKYFESLGGCARGADCLYAHGEAELSWGKLRHRELMQGKQMNGCPSTTELEHKIFVGGLPQNVDSDTLKEFFEDLFGTVEDSFVIKRQAGDEVVSRGFGFITFKNKDSVDAAVQLHYLNFLEKKIEIKEAVSASDLLSHIPKATPTDQKKSQGVIDANEMYTTERRQESLSWVDTLLHCQPRNQPHVKIDLTPKDQSLPSWVITFKRWLPGFLKHVSKHQKKGEWYALSHLKLDFKTNCGLELDHASVGYPKLSDFVGSFPDVCRMELVPVHKGGHASHMVLLPTLPTPPDHKKCHQLKEPEDYTNLPSVDEEDDFTCLSNLIAATVYRNISYAGTREGLSSSYSRDGKQAENGKNNRTYPDQRLPASGDKTTGLQNQGSGGGQDSRGGNINHILMVLQAEKKQEFSYFIRQPTFFRDYREKYLAQGKCFRCEKNLMMWASFPCGHLLWCTPCMTWITNCPGQQTKRCVICDAKVERCEFQTWRKTESHSAGSTTPVPANDNFPAWDIEAARTKPRKRDYFCDAPRK